MEWLLKSAFISEIGCAIFRWGTLIITAVVTTTLADVENSAARVLISTLGGLFNSVALVVFLFAIDRRVGIIAAAGVLFYVLATKFAGRKSSVLSEERQFAQESLVESVLEYIQGMGIWKIIEPLY